MKVIVVCKTLGTKRTTTALAGRRPARLFTPFHTTKRRPAGRSLRYRGRFSATCAPAICGEPGLTPQGRLRALCSSLHYARQIAGHGAQAISIASGFKTRHLRMWVQRLTIASPLQAYVAFHRRRRPAPGQRFQTPKLHGMTVDASQPRNRTSSLALRLRRRSQPISAARIADAGRNRSSTGRHRPELPVTYHRPRRYQDQVQCMREGAYDFLAVLVPAPATTAIR